VVFVVGELVPLDRLEGLSSLHRVDRISMLNRVRRLILLGGFSRFGRCDVLGSVRLVSSVGHVVQIDKGNSRPQVPLGVGRWRYGQ
jgi:hypothetical protein